MDVLNSKIGYLRDLAAEHHSSVQSLEIVTEATQNLLDILEKEIGLRNREKTGFVTRVGVALREGLLQHYNAIVNQVPPAYSGPALLLQCIRTSRPPQPAAPLPP